MAKLQVPREQVKKMLAECIRAGTDVDAMAEVAETNWRHRDWLDLFAKWRDDTIKVLKSAYEGKDIAQEFEFATQTTDRSSSRSTFEKIKEGGHRRRDTPKLLLSCKFETCKCRSRQTQSMRWE